LKLKLALFNKVEYCHERAAIVWVSKFGNASARRGETPFIRGGKIVERQADLSHLIC
jgi:hypothetical protein